MVVPTRQMRKAQSESLPGKIMECVLLESASEHLKNKKATRHT